VKLLTTDIRYQDKIAKLDGTGSSPFAWAQIPIPVLTSSSLFALFIAPVGVSAHSGWKAWEKCSKQ
jgi:hypothetical protein